MNRATYVLCIAALLGGGCGDDGTEAVRRGVGAECSVDGDCTEEGQRCLTEFKGGYCGVSACVHDDDCPEGSACVTEEDGINYCFLVCAEKPECNPHRSVDNESNCTSSLTFVDGTMNRKACRPPLSGTTTPDAGALDAATTGG